MRKTAIFLIRLYQKFPKLFPTPCIYIPTCSEYAKQAFGKHCFIRALGLTMFRVLRCNPFSKGGLDPVR
ncbi:MAG: membrane protein insertion efficiency factor YidD [Candidatus Omnitrophica bacterium]|nr:membrane protein insertion efficiency factor YidD [Candidatus Omnitrophota bacterium]MCF7894695.1 membrane protein insertion efficiency factor YidD [Candidatus Omnitrophota bacterium]